PILAVIALHAFTVAYSNFMFALLICQDERMWTLMVWLYQLQARSGQAVIYASLLVAALPTLLLFLFCQKIILRGIVIPVER
ncbi:MAG TPA: sugar ABC transporter permease, partial [Kiritimatiellia bacterium]|nr:sugar ABC transporter permease [Kiritimatiellia bacterium]